MSVEAVKKYLEENKAKYPRETLAGELRGGGYPEDEIQAGLQAVYGGVGVSPATFSFWDFRSVRTYHHGIEKFIDFVAGFFAALVFFTALPSFSGFTPIVLFVGILVIFSCWKKRRYVALGMLFGSSLAFSFISLFINFISLFIG